MNQIIGQAEVIHELLAMHAHSQVLGILGGAGSLAAARFTLAYTEAWATTRQIKTDKDFPHIILNNFPNLGIDNRGKASLATQAMLRVQVTKMAEQCHLIVPLCFSLEKHITTLPTALRGKIKPLSYLVDQAVTRKGLASEKFLLLGAKPTIKVWKSTAYKFSFPGVTEQTQIDQFIEKSLTGQHNPQDLRNWIQNTFDVPVILACTELTV